MAAKTLPCFVFGAFAILGPVRGVHREELPASPYPDSLQHLQRVMAEIAEARGNASNGSIRRPPMPLHTVKWSDFGGNDETGTAGANDTDVFVSTHELPNSSPKGAAKTTEEDEAKVGADADDLTHKLNMSSLSSEAGRRLANSAIEAMKRVKKAAEDQDREAAKVMEKASVMFAKARDAQEKADAASKSALDSEAQLVDAKASALRSVTSAQELTVAAVKATMDESAESSSSSFSLHRDTHTAEEAVLNAKHSLDTVREKLSNAEKASAAAQQAATQAAREAVAAHRELQAAKDVAAKAAAKRARVEEQFYRAADEISLSAKAFDSASKAKAEALQAVRVAKQDLADTAKRVVAVTQAAENGPSQRTSLLSGKAGA